MENETAVTTLSPAAQAVLDAFENASDGEYVEGVWVVNERTMLSAALRAAADQVVPVEMDLPPIAPDLGHFRQHERRLTRQRLLAIAAELEGAN
jgi:hypothetical protein